MLGIAFVAFVSLQGIDNDVFWYYMLELSFYTSLTVSQFTDIKRKVTHLPVMQFAPMSS